MTSYEEELERILTEAQKLAVEYYQLTQKPLGVTAEMGEYWASKLLNLTLAEVRTAGYDAFDETGRKIQIKARVIQDLKKAGRMGAIKLTHEWDSVVLVVLNKDMTPHSIHEATREDIVVALNKTASKARQRGALGVREFMGAKLSQKRWTLASNP